MDEINKTPNDNKHSVLDAFQKLQNNDKWELEDIKSINLRVCMLRSMLSFEFLTNP